MASHASDPSLSRRNAYDIVTDQIVALLDAGTCPWRKPWDPGISGVRPLNIRGSVYRGSNRAILSSMGYDSPIWLTFKQATERGGHVRKGEHGTPVVYWHFLDRAEVPDDMDSEEKPKGKRSATLRYYTAFNLDQTEDVRVPDGMRERFTAIAHREYHPIAEATAIVDGYQHAPSVRHTGGKAYYRPSDDSVTMPEPGSFHSDETYYGVLFHELGHSTGHESRLARSGVTDTNMFGSHEYSQEELVAEMTSAFLSADCGIGRPLIENSAAYIASWLRALKDDRRLFVYAAGQAQKAADHILGVTS